MTESEWESCEDPDRLLAAARGSTHADALRRVACACCRRIFEKPRRLFDTFVYRSGGVDSQRWRAETLLAAVAGAEAPESRASAERLRPEVISAAASSAYERWQWANYRLGDSASGEDYEDAFVTWKSAAAVAACCADDIGSSIAECLACAAEAIGFRWITEERTTAVAAERKAQAAVIRAILDRPR